MPIPVISYVVTVYNKEPYIGFTTKSLLQQEGGIPAEYIFVDDVSKDGSLAVIESITQGMPNVTIIKNATNAGPNIRLNQGARLARGEYLQFIDSDDILAANASQVMLRLLKDHKADVIYGRWKKTGIVSRDLLGTRIDLAAPYKMSDRPMQFQFEERILRMTQMVRRDIFMRSGGCDEGIFIQDESVAMRLMATARRAILLDAPVVLVPKVEGELSGNVSQLNHDRFLANRNMILNFPDMDERYRRLFYRRCISAMWKQKRHESGLPKALFSVVFARYLISRLYLAPLNSTGLNRMSGYFAKLQGVRRVGG